MRGLRRQFSQIDLYEDAMRGLIGFLTAFEIMLSAFCARADAVPERVTFPSADGRTWPLTGSGCRVGRMAAARHSPRWRSAPLAARKQDFVPRWRFIRPAG